MGDFIIVMLRDSTSILFVALGILVMQLSGIINIGAEGMMLLGAFSGILGVYLSGSRLIGLLFALLVLAFFGLLFGFLTIYRKGNQVVVGVAFNILAEGITTTLSRQIFGTGSHSSIQGFPTGVLGLSSMTYAAIALVFILYFFFNQTNLGLRIRACGDYPTAVDVAGINVYQIQLFAVIFGSMIIALGGCSLSMAQMNSFSELMSGGRGYIALAAVALGQYKPFGVFFASLLFGASNTIQYTLQASITKFPAPIIRMLPYLITTIAVIISGRNSREPASLGVKYVKFD